MSYMNYKKIILEATLKDFMKYFKIFKNLKLTGGSKTDKQLLKNPKIKKAFSAFNKSVDKFYAEIEKQNAEIKRKERGL